MPFEYHGSSRTFSPFGPVIRSYPNSVGEPKRADALQPAIEEYLYSAMEDRRIDITVESGAGARIISINLNAFTLVGVQPM